MSQFFVGTSDSNLPPDVPTSFQTQNGTAVPALNVLIVHGVSSTENNDNGIIAKGGVVGTGTSNEVDLAITNRLQGSGSTVGAVTADIITFTPTVVGTYDLEFRASAYNTTSTIGAGYKVFGAIRFDGVNCNLCGTADTFDNEEGAMSACDIDIIVGSSTILRVTGYAAQTINWGAVGEYTFRGI